MATYFPPRGCSKTSPEAQGGGVRVDLAHVSTNGSSESRWTDGVNDKLEVNGRACPQSERPQLLKYPQTDGGPDQTVVEHTPLLIHRGISLLK